MSKTVLFQTIQFSISTQFKCQTVLFDPYIGLSGATIPDQNGPGSDSNEGLPCISQSSSINGASPSDYFVEESYSSAEIQSVYSAAPADWAENIFGHFSRVASVLLLFKLHAR